MEAGELMEIYNEQMERIKSPDLKLGWLEDATRTIEHAAVEAVEEIWHYEIVAQYPNGGTEVCRVIDVPGVEAKAAWTETVDIQIYHPYTPEELAAMEEERSRPTNEERLRRLENAMDALGEKLDEAHAWIMTLVSAKGEE